MLLILEFKKTGEPSIKQNNEIPANRVKVEDTKGRRTTLERVDTNKNVKMLGVIKTSSLYDKEEYKYLLENKKITQKQQHMSIKEK